MKVRDAGGVSSGVGVGTTIVRLGKVRSVWADPG